MSQKKKGLIAVWCFCLFFLPLTLSLGFWQLDRAEQKKVLDQKHAKLGSRQPVLISDRSEIDEEFRPYRIYGHYAPEYFLLDNRISEGQVGYEVLQLFRTEAGFSLLVNRGWIAAPRLREEIPEVLQLNNKVGIEGFFYQSDGEVPLLNQSNFESFDQQHWPKRIQKLAWDELAAILSVSDLIKREFRLGSGDVPGALRINWRSTEMGPEKHLGYAVQWFSLAFALLLLTLYFSFRSRNE